MALSVTMNCGGDARSVDAISGCLLVDCLVLICCGRALCRASSFAVVILLPSFDARSHPEDGRGLQQRALFRASKSGPRCSDAFLAVESA